MKRRLKALCQAAELPFEETKALAHDKLCDEHLSGKGGNTWITKEGWELLSTATVVPEAVPDHLSARVIKPARNKRYVFAKIKDGMKVPVLVPTKFHKRLTGKNIAIEVIEDVKGKTYRYVKS